MFAVAGVDVSVKECRRMLQAMASAVPSVMRWHGEIEHIIRKTRTLTNPLGLSRTFLGMVDNDMLREAVAFVPQSTVGMLLNYALERIYHESDILNETDLLLQNHDAVLGQTPDDLLEEHTEKVGRLMTIPLVIKGRELVIPSDLKVGRSWGELK